MPPDPIVPAGAGSPPPPPPANPPPPEPHRSPPPAIADLAGLQAAINQAKTEGTSSATSQLLSALGFDSPATAQKWVESKRQEDDARKTEHERAIEAAQRAQQAAEQQAAVAQAEARRATTTLALAAAGAPADKAGALVPMVAVDGEATADNVKKAVDQLKKDWPQLFASAVGLPSGATGVAPPGGQPAPVTGYEAGRRRAEAEVKASASKDKFLAGMHRLGQSN